MHYLDLKLPSRLFAQILRVTEVGLRQWIRGTNFRDNYLELDGQIERPGGARFFSFTDLVRIQILLTLRDDFGVSTKVAVQMCNLAFGDIAHGVKQVWSDRAGVNQWTDLNGPFLSIYGGRWPENLHACLFSDRAACASTVTGCVLVQIDLACAVYKAFMTLQRDDVADDIVAIMRSK